MLLRIDSSTHDDTSVLAVSGEIDIDTVDLLRSAVTDALQAGVRDLIIDLNQVTYLDSAGLGMLVGTYKRLTAEEGSLTVRCCVPRILRLFTITRLTDLLRIDRTPPTDDVVTEDRIHQVTV